MEAAASFILVMLDDVMPTNENEQIVVTGNRGLQVSFLSQAAAIPLIRQLLEG